MRYLPLLCGISLLLNLQTKAQNYEVINPTQNGYTIEARNHIYLNTPEGSTLQLSRWPFVTQNTNEAPTEPVLAKWSPDGRFVAVFVQQDRSTSIYVVDLKTNSPLQQKNTDVTLPSWMTAGPPIASTRTLPNGEWEGKTLPLLTQVKLRGAPEQRTLAESLQITSSGTFSCEPAKPKPSKKPTGLEW